MAVQGTSSFQSDQPATTGVRRPGIARVHGTVATWKG